MMGRDLGLATGASPRLQSESGTDSVTNRNAVKSKKVVVGSEERIIASAPSTPVDQHLPAALSLAWIV